MWEKGNRLMEEAGYKVGRGFYKNSSFQLPGLTVENHRYMVPFRGNNRLRRLGIRLQEMKKDDVNGLRGLSGSRIGDTWLYRPPVMVSVLFLIEHAYSHFLHEKIELRHVVDWAVALRQLTAEEAEEVGRVKGTSPWGRFTDTMTAIALHRFALPQEWFPVREVAAAAHISPEQEERVWNDIITAPHIATRGTTLRRRIMIGRRLMKNRWKFREYAEVSAERFLLEEFWGWARSGLIALWFKRFKKFKGFNGLKYGYYKRDT